MRINSFFQGTAIKKNKGGGKGNGTDGYTKSEIDRLRKERDDVKKQLDEAKAQNKAINLQSHRLRAELAEVR